MRKNLLAKAITGLLLLFGTVPGHTQSSFAWKTPVNPVPATRFYAIQLTPEVLASCLTPELADLRLVDIAGKTVPYLLNLSSTVNTAPRMVPYRIVSNVRKDSTSEIIIRNESSGAIGALSLLIKNASAYRKGVLTGSDDNRTWFMIDEQVVINPVTSAAGDKFVQPLTFPLSNYRYFRLTIYDRGLVPLNILEAGVPQHAIQPGRYLPVPSPRLVQIDSSDHYTYLVIKFARAFKIDKLSLHITRPSLYKRSFVLEAVKPERQPDLEQGDLRPGMDSIMLNTKAGELLLRIYNGDNPPLQVESVSAYQAERQMVAQLEKDRSYFVLTGNAQASKPDYDLQFFRDSIFANLAQVALEPVRSNAVTTPVVAQANSYSKPIMWVTITAVLLLLLWLTFRMSKEIGQKTGD